MKIFASALLLIGLYYIFHCADIVFVVLNVQMVVIQLFGLPLGAQLGLGTQPHYKAPGDLHVENVKNAVINIG